MKFTVEVPKSHTDKNDEAMDKFDRDRAIREARNSFITANGRIPDQEFEP